MKTIVFAATAITLAALAGPALAQVRPSPPPPPPPATVITTVAVTPTVPGGPGSTPDNQTYDPPQRIAPTYERCGWQLGKLRDVGADQIRAIADAGKVRVIPICEYKSLVGDQKANSFLSQGNVGGLVGTIGRNGALRTALAGDDYRADDVVGIVMTPGKGAILYVHKRK